MAASPGNKGKKAGAGKRAKRPASKKAARSRPGPKANLKQARSAVYRAAVIDAAEAIIARRGVDDTKMDEVAAEAGLSLGTLYSVFSGKADLIRAIHETRMAEMMARIDAAAVGCEGTLDLLLAGIRGYVEFFAAHPHYLETYLRENNAWGVSAAASSPARADAWSEGMKRQERLFRRGMEEGVFHEGDPAQMAGMLVAMQQVQLAFWDRKDPAEPTERLIEEMAEQVRRSFCR